MNKSQTKIATVIIEALLSRGFAEAEAEQMIQRIARLGPEATIRSYSRIPFGKHYGLPLDEIPIEYLLWLQSQEWFAEKYSGLKIELEELLEKS